MPSITTHHIFATQVFTKLNKDTKKHFNHEKLIYTTFAQSHDYLFYYTFDLKNAKRIRALGHNAHHNHTQNYILNIINEIKTNNLENNEQCLAYLYGVITHYVLDSTCHPFIFYKTGIYRKGNKHSKIYRGEHNRMEKDIDAIFYERTYHQTYNHCNLNKDIIKKPIFNNELINLINKVYKKTYNEDNIGYFYLKSIKHTKIINTLAINDYFGIKRLLYTFIDFITNKRFGNIAAYSTYRKHPDTSLLNNDHQKWNHPSIKEKTYTYSFDDLVDIAEDKAIKIIEKINNYLFSNERSNIDLTKLIPDIDYSTGLVLKDNIRMDYFERG